MDRFCPSGTCARIIFPLLVTDVVWCGLSVRPSANRLWDNTTTSPNRRIPDILLFTHKKQLFEPTENVLSADDLRVKENLRKTIAMHPGMQMEFYDDERCRQALLHVNMADSIWVADFDREPEGKYKSDLCRLAMLHEHGGYYMDNDLEVLMDFREVIPSSTTLATSLEFGHSDHVFQAFFAATKAHPILWKALEKTAGWYTAGRPNATDIPAGPVLVGAAMLEFLKVPNLQPGPLVDMYFLNETDEIDQFGLHKRGEDQGCNIVVSDHATRRAVAWSRFVGASSTCSLDNAKKEITPEMLRHGIVY